VSPANGVSASDPQAQFNYIVELKELGIAYLHVVEGERDIAPFDYESLRRKFKNTYIANGYDLELAATKLRQGLADLFASADRSSPIRILSGA
jgi:N-ethylmaleimide reductase